MPHHKSCIKRMKTSVKARERNRAFRSRLRAALKDLRIETNKDKATELLPQVISLVDRAASYGLIHKKNADRNKSRLTRFVAQLG